MEGITAAVNAVAHDELITLEDCPETFTVSKAMLYSTSDYFVKALNGNFVEAETRTMKLPGCSVETFGLFLYYAANKTLPDFLEAVRLKPDSLESRTMREAYLLHLVRLWAFGDAYLMPKLQNKAMVCMLGLINVYGAIFGVSSSAVALASDISSENSLLYKMAVKEAAYVCVFGNYAAEAMERLSALPGFFKLMIAAVKAHYTEGMTFDSYPRANKNHKDYMVDEESAK